MAHWRERPEGGNRFWLVLIRWCILHVGRGFAQFCMFPTTLYFFLVRGSERRASREWLRRVGAPHQGWWGVMIHIYTFAITIVDRVLLLAGRGDELDVHPEGVEHLHDMLDRGHGCMLLGSHLGSFEAIRVFNRQAPSQYRKLKVVMDRNQNSLMTQMMEEISPDIRDTVIDASQPGPAIVLEAGGVMEDGGMVAMLADRTWGSEAAVAVSFLDRPTRLPASPLAIADILDAPVVMVFGLYEGRRRYRLVFEPLPATAARSKSRSERRRLLNERIQHYADRLAHYARQYPYNWFNFYDFWTADTDPDRRGDDD
ncbi:MULTISPECIES: acyltransferase [unclassified Wenzhouxiangella]|uniref:LpxL/LpxP family acyltransferase n=1 Tax=unclassified Wenzhouxiangella TaxID=2613841 RepID=UPI0011C03877|nr:MULTISPECIES: acyltransferase [unclassified Wenzhouxiangella]